ncbi:unnamed protein product [Sphenostylis stenocarpa]|uniref:Uncharacterized protein n=1 Tax=Sphenostylis stenocarpa TaxID=92480 RepID=A0AA86T123_9FABA|nr:unnamed protein product [Sphenostylis stenocarpa]
MSSLGGIVHVNALIEEVNKSMHVNSHHSFASGIIHVDRSCVNGSVYVRALIERVNESMHVNSHRLLQVGLHDALHLHELYMCRRMTLFHYDIGYYKGIVDKVLQNPVSEGGVGAYAPKMFGIPKSEKEEIECLLSSIVPSLLECCNWVECHHVEEVLHVLKSMPMHPRVM